MSKEILKFVNNIIDKEDSEYYLINKRKRHFWHSRSETISCKVRNKNNFNKAPDIALNVRAFLLNEEKFFNKMISVVMSNLYDGDMEQIRDYIYLCNPNKAKEEIDKNIGLYVMSLDENEIRAALNLNKVISCRLLGYEKELFYLKCYTVRILPVFMLRVLYHVKNSHLKLKNLMDNPSIYKGIDFEYYLSKIQFH